MPNWNPWPTQGMHNMHCPKPFGGSYSASGGGSMQSTLTGRAERPKLAQVAAALLKAKREGQLPSAFGDITLPGTNLENVPENPEGTGGSANGDAAPGAQPPPLEPININPAVKNKFMAAAHQIKAQQQSQSQQEQQRSVPGLLVNS